LAACTPAAEATGEPLQCELTFGKKQKKRKFSEKTKSGNPREKIKIYGRT
jgi:hypothetical protein